MIEKDEWNHDPSVMIRGRILCKVRLSWRMPSSLNFHLSSLDIRDGHAKIPAPTASAE